MAIKWTNESAINREIDMAERHTDPSDSVWDMAEQQKWKVNLSHKNVQGKEKQVDAKMVTDIVETACKEMPSTMALITGNRDFVCAIKKAQEYNWKVEVYDWNKSMPEEIKHMHDNGSVQITSIDVHFNEFMITELQFDSNIVKEKGALNLNGIVFEVIKIPADWITVKT